MPSHPVPSWNNEQINPRRIFRLFSETQSFWRITTKSIPFWFIMIIGELLTRLLIRLSSRPPPPNLWGRLASGTAVDAAQAACAPLPMSHTILIAIIVCVVPRISPPSNHS